MSCGKPKEYKTSAQKSMERIVSEPKITEKDLKKAPKEYWGPGKDLIRRWKRFDHYDIGDMGSIILLDKDDNRLDEFSSMDDLIQGWIDCQIGQAERRLEEVE